MARGERKTSGRTKSSAKKSESASKRAATKPKARRTTAQRATVKAAPANGATVTADNRVASEAQPTVKRASMESTPQMATARKPRTQVAVTAPKLGDDEVAPVSNGTANVLASARAWVEPSWDQIALRAYTIWERTGAPADANWFQAEAELKAESETRV